MKGRDPSQFVRVDEHLVFYSDHDLTRYSRVHIVRCHVECYNSATLKYDGEALHWHPTDNVVYRHNSESYHPGAERLQDIIRRAGRSELVTV